MIPSVQDLKAMYERNGLQPCTNVTLGEHSACVFGIMLVDTLGREIAEGYLQETEDFPSLIAWQFGLTKSQAQSFIYGFDAEDNALDLTYYNLGAEYRNALIQDLGSLHLDGVAEYIDSGI